MNKFSIFVAGLGLGAFAKFLSDIKVVKVEINDELEEEKKDTVKVFISCPMNGKTNEEIENRIEECKNADLNALPDEIIKEKNVEFISGYKPNQDYKNMPVACLAGAIEALAEADYVMFGKGWKEARGCSIEHEIADKYNIKCIYEEADDYTSVKEN